MKSLEVLQGFGPWHCIEASDEVAQEVGAFCNAFSSVQDGIGVTRSIAPEQVLESHVTFGHQAFQLPSSVF